MTIIYGQIHVCVDKAEDSDFDLLYFGKDENEILKKVKTDFVQRIVNSNYGSSGSDLEETMDSIYNLLQVKTADEMKNWFNQYYSYYTFGLFSQEN